jgi:hypothetical protein
MMMQFVTVSYRSSFEIRASAMCELMKMNLFAAFFSGVLRVN